MEAFKGTKGEWTVPHFATDRTECNCGYVLNPMYGGAIATVHFGEENPPIEEAKANAKLIAAAPELLEALQVLVDLKYHKDAGGKDEYYYKRQPLAWEAAETAIKKASE